MNETTKDTVNSVMENKVKIWLRQARDRDGGRKRRFQAARAKQIAEKRRHFDDLPIDTDDSDMESDN
jgi:hypothetical protein